MHHVWKMIISIFKYCLVSLFVTGIGFIVSTSFMTGKFPPSLAQFKNVKKNFEGLMALRQQISDKQNIAQLKPLDKDSGQKAEGSRNSSESAPSSAYNDPEMADVSEVLKYHKQQVAIANTVSGEASFSSNPPPSDSNTSSVDSKLEERVRKMEDLLGHFQGQIEKLNARIDHLQSINSQKR